MRLIRTLPMQEWLAGIVLLLFCFYAGAESSVPATTNSTVNLGLAEVVQHVLQRNESLQGKLLAMEASRHRYLAEKGVFEPEAFANISREVNKRQNNTEQAAAANGVSVLEETNDVYGGGIEAQIETGAKLRVGYNLTDLRNNIPPSIFGSPVNGDQWQTFYGLSVEQPLLKNFGPAVSMAAIRVAALSSRIAFQEYRQQLMTLVSSAEATYWNLYLAQEQARFFEESVATAQTILNDNRTRLEAGKGSELEVLEAQAGLGLRQAKLEEARQKVFEAANRVLSLSGEAASETGMSIRAADAPKPRADLPDRVESRQQAFWLNPDYLIQEEKIEQDRIRLGYAKNQRLPSLNLKGAYGLNGLGDSPSTSWQNVSDASFPSWSVGLEFRVPLGGGERSRHELAAAQLQVQSGELALHSLQTDMLNGMDTAWHKVQSARNSVGNYQAAVNYNQSLLESALARLEAGKIESRKVFEIEADLLQAKNAVAESLVRDEVARLELEVLEGVLLQKRNLEVSQKELELATHRYQRGLNGAREMYEDTQRPVETTDTPQQEMLRRKMREKQQQLDMKNENPDK